MCQRGLKYHAVDQLAENVVQNSEVHWTIRPPLFLYYYPGESWTANVTFSI